MRRHSAASEAPLPHSRIICEFPSTTNDQRVNLWPENGYRRPCKGKKASKKNEMAASVLPTSNAYNDFRVKYHSVSGGSALSQSMKYAEAWLYGSLSVKPSPSRPTLFDYGRRKCAPLASVCRCSSARLGATTEDQGACNYAQSVPSTTAPAPPTLCAAGKRGTPPSKCCDTAAGRREPLTDPYDAVRRSRLGGVRSERLARAKSHSPSDRKGADRRKSILDCDLNAYDLLKRNSSDEAGYASQSDEDGRRVAAAAASTRAAGDGKRKKKQRKLTFGYKSRTKLKEPSERASAKVESETTFVDDVSIAGQKIRIFNVFDRTSPRSADVTTDDWISDPNDEVCVPPAPEPQDADVTLSNNDSDDVAQVSVGKHPLLLDNRFSCRGNNVREPVPQRPPRRRCCRSEESESNVAIVVINPIANAAGGYIKSILKKPCSADEPAITAHHHTVVDVATYASTTLDGANAASDTCSVTWTPNYDAASGYICSGCEQRLFAATCYCTLDGHRKKAKMGRKIKKQVQFKGMRGDVAGGGGANSSRSGATGAGDGEGAATLEEDESGSRLMDDADVSVVAATAETGYAIDVDRSITRSVAVVASADALGAVSDPQRRIPRLVCDVAGDYSRALPFASADCSPSSADVCSSVTRSVVPRRILSPPPSSSTPSSPSTSPPSKIVTILSDRLSSLPAAPTQSVALQQRQPSPPTPPSPPDVESASTSSSSETLRKTYSTGPVASPAPPPTRSYPLVTESANEVFTSTLETGFGRRHNRHAIRSSSLCKLQRTLSECVTARPLLVGLHRKSFTDTMRLQMRSDGRPADARALFAAHQSPRHAAVAQPRSPGEGFRIALPDSGPVESALGNLPVPVTFASFESAAAFSPHHYVGDLSAVCSVERGEPIFISVNDNVDADGVRIPSLTQTFLQNRLCANNTATVAVASPAGVVVCDQNRDRRAKSVIKINVSSAPVAGIASTAENCTIVTISGGASSTPSCGQHAAAAPASTVVRLDEQPAPPTTCRKNNSVVRLNVSADEPLYSNCGPVDDTGNSSATATTVSSYATTDDGDTYDADFSLHYMSCEINGKLTEEEVGLSRTRPPTEKDEDEADEVEEEEEEAYDAEPIYEEIPELTPPSAPPPPLPSKPPPEKVEDGGIVIPPRSIFEGASKYDILTYLAGAKERCRIPSEIPRFVIEEADTDAEASSADADVDELSRGIAADAALRLSQHSSGVGAEPTDLSRRISHLSSVSDSSDELACFLACAAAINSEKQTRKNSAEIERNDSGVGSETSQCSRSKWQQVRTNSLLEDQQLVCEDCDQVIESNNCENGLIYAPLVCRKCSKRRVERREIITEIVETEEKYGRDLRIILDEFYKPMLVAGLLTAEQLSSVFLNVEELLEHNTILAEKLRDGYEIAVEQGDEDLLTFNVGQIFLDATPMLHAFESYCTRQGNAALLLANLEREKELLKIFLRVSQMENTVLRRMNLNSFLMVPVQRVTKYPLLLARLYKVTPEHHIVQRELLKEARHNIELHLEHINSVTKDIGSTKIWRRISMINGRRVNGDIDDIISLKLQKIAVEVLEWGHDEVRFVMEGRLLYAQCTDCNWKRSGRTVKVVPINALLVTLGKPTENYNPELDDLLMFPQKNGIREASLLLMKEKSGKYSLVREPFFLDNCIIYCDGDYEEYFEVQEIHSKETYIFKGEDGERTKRWFRQLQYHCQGLGGWRRRRNALANIMINGMKIRNQ